MFPSILDNAKVLYHTPPGSYGELRLTTGETDDYISYLAVCQYPDSGEYYLFGCNAEYEVITDWPCETAQKAMDDAQFSRSAKIIWITP